MELLKTEFEGLFVLETNNFQDNRGSFQKIFNKDFFESKGLDTDFKEIYYSISRKNVIRGMHFQIPPYDHTKLVYVSSGEIIDIVVDLRRKSSSYGKYFSIELDERDAKYLYIPKGFAHGFIALEDKTIVNYAQTSCYSKTHDLGIRYSSIDFNWPVNNPIVSERDLSFGELINYQSPF